ncbi:MAG TPA: DUF4157 domain-containing protein [Opitutaceae bacterium]
MTRGFRPPPVARRAHGPAPLGVPRIVNDVLAQPGQPLDPDTCARMEQSLGGRFDVVRVHVGGSATVSAHAIRADAYAVGRHLVFAANRYAPSTPAGERLLAHELTHAKQQHFADPPATLEIGPTHDPAEAEASAAELRAGRQPVPAHATPASRIMRSPDESSDDEASPDEPDAPVVRPTRLYGFSSAELSRGQPFTDEQIYGELNAANERIARENPPARPPFAKRYARAQREIPTPGYSAYELFDFGKSRGYFHDDERDTVYEKHYGRIAKHSKTRDQFETEQYNQQINRFRAFRNQMNLAPIQATLLGPARAFGTTASGLYFSYQTADTIVQTHRAVRQGDTATAVVIGAPALLGLAIPRLLRANPTLPVTRSGNGIEVQVITKPVVTSKAIAQGYKVGDRPVLYIAEVDPQVVPGNQLPNTVAGTAPSGFFVRIKARVVDAQSGEVLASREAWAPVPAPDGPPVGSAPPTTTTPPSNPRLPPSPTADPNAVAATQGSARRAETVADFQQRGGQITHLPPVKPKADQASRAGANPKQDAPLPEGFEDVFEHGNVSRRNASRGKSGDDIWGTPKDRTTAGTFAHNSAEVLQRAEVLVDIMKRTPGRNGIFSSPIPKDAVPEFAVPHPDYPAGMKPRIDRLIRDAGEIIEIKPAHLRRQGDIEAQQYAAWMDKYHPRPDGRPWTWRTITYDQAKLLAYLQRIGYFE